MVDAGYRRSYISWFPPTGQTIPFATEPLTIPSRPLIRQFWQETKSVQQVAERTGISLGLAHRLIREMLAEETK